MLLLPYDILLSHKKKKKSLGSFSDFRVASNQQVMHPTQIRGGV